LGLHDSRSGSVRLAYGTWFLLLPSGLCVGVAVLWPGQSIMERLRVLACAAFLIAVAYIFFKAVLAWLAAVGVQFFGRVAFWYTAFVLYAGIVVMPFALLSLPFQWRGLCADGMTGPMFLASIPSSVAASLAAARVIEKHYVAV
jgi:hypothetical protein